MITEQHYKTTLNKLTCTATDSELVERIRDGDIDTFELIMRRHNQRLYRLARSFLRDDDEAMDVVQDSYVKAFYQLHQFKGPDGFAGWLSRIVSNESMMRIRKSSRIVYISDDSEKLNMDITSPEPQPMEYLSGQQTQKLLEDAIDLLPMDYRCVYVMRAVQQLSTSETADSLGVSDDVIKTRYLRAKNRLQKILEKQIEDAGLSAFEFAGHRCDFIVQGVLARLKNK